MRASVVAIVLFCVAGGAVAACVYWHDRMPWPVGAYATMSFITYVAYWRDKRRAQGNRWRVSEATLHGLELLGGWPGALVAQQVLRHKTRKISFQIVFWLIVAAHVAFWTWWLVLRK